MEGREQAARIGFWGKLQSIALTAVAVMLWFGQWNDTKEAVNSAYESFVAHWTNDIEYKQISHLHVGQTKAYVTSLFGTPHVSKRSSVDTDVYYFYYGHPKYQLTLAIKDERLSGYAIVGLQPDFQAAIPYLNRTLLSDNLASYFLGVDSYFSDANNLEYYAEAHDLGKSVMFYSLILGAVNYGSLGSQDVAVIAQLNAQLDRGVDDIGGALAASRKLEPNYFAVTELAPQVMIEALLTHFEYKTLLKSQ
ncbi:ETEC_3214 domain-containing protein [Shewanella pneumatophori]|uniref:Outer membrane protein assembly factor BamE n=1 Tax=Shewanella pneumatophori TaxID=314092 RepID=A0A9X1ZJ29_9GAMM|nr:ETEC_3214 domain-containing protein [Shewanella pneumatophori]MCL1140745.1 outer membrane protein assembly factor BamE [Shewanella pneumatophori]